MAKRETRSNGVSQLERYRYGKLISSSARDEKIQWNGTRKKGEGGGRWREMIIEQFFNIAGVSVGLIISSFLRPRSIFREVSLHFIVQVGSQSF